MRGFFLYLQCRGMRMESNKMSGAELVVQALKALKVKYIFWLPWWQCIRYL